MANEVLVKNGTKICFGLSGTLSPADPGTDWRGGETPSYVAITCAGLANSSARQSAKTDLGATRAPRFAVYAAADFLNQTPTQGLSVDYYWAPSSSTTTGTANVAGNSGNDAACPDGALGSLTYSDFILQCQFIGSLIIHDGASVQNGYVGTFSPAERYGQLIVVNESGDQFDASSDDENHVVFTPLVDEVQ